MDGRLPRAMNATVVVVSMLVQAAVGQAACICDEVAATASAALVHEHHLTSSPGDTSGPVPGHDHHGDQVSAVEPAAIALASCCCAQVGRGTHAPRVDGQPVTLTTLHRGTIAPSTWTLAAAIVPAQVAEVRASRLGPATPVARPPLILRI